MIGRPRASTDPANADDTLYITGASVAPRFAGRRVGAELLESAAELTPNEIFEFVRARIATKLPETAVEHIGSSSVPGMPGKGYVDVMVLPSDATEIAHVVRELEALGLQHARGSRPERPFFLAAVQHNGRVTNVHVHVIISESDEARAQRGLARALRDDPKLRRVLETLERLGLPRLPDPGDPPATHRDR